MPITWINMCVHSCCLMLFQLLILLLFGNLIRTYMELHHYETLISLPSMNNFHSLTTFSTPFPLFLQRNGPLDPRTGLTKQSLILWYLSIGFFDSPENIPKKLDYHIFHKHHHFFLTIFLKTSPFLLLNINISISISWKHQHSSFKTSTFFQHLLESVNTFQSSTFLH